MKKKLRILVNYILITMLFLLTISCSGNYFIQDSNNNKENLNNNLNNNNINNNNNKIMNNTIISTNNQNNYQDIDLLNDGIEELHIYNWEDYLGETTIEDFESDYGIKVFLDTYEDEDFMLADLQSDPGKYDLVVVSNSQLLEMIELRLLEKIDKKNIPNMIYIDDNFLNLKFDPNNQYSIPYLWGTTGIIYNDKYINESVTSFDVLYDERYKGKISMLNSNYEVIGAALTDLGFGMIPNSEEELNLAKKKVLFQKPLLRGYEDTITIRDSMIAEELWAAQLYSGEANVAINQNPHLKYLTPNNHTVIWIDNFAIPSDAKNKHNAELFINYILIPEVNAKIVNYQYYATSNVGANKYINEEILNTETIYPKNAFESSMEMNYDNKFINEYNQIWAELQR